MENQNSPQCAICGIKQPLQRCAKCKTIYYCSSVHQHIDWPEHKQSCRMLAKQKGNKMQQLQQAIAATTLSNNIQYADSGGGGGMNAGYIVPTVLSSNILSEIQSNNSVILTNNENELLNSQAETVSQNSNIVYYGNLDANSTTMEQMQFRHNGSNSVSSIPLEHFFNEEYHNQQQLQQQQQPQQHLSQIPSTPSHHGQQQQHPHHQQQQEHYLNYNNHEHNSQNEKSLSYQIGGQLDENTIGSTNERRYDDLCRNIISDLNEYGLSVVDDFLGPQKGLQILNEVHRMYSAGVFKDGKLVKNLLNEQDLHTIRGDKITWVKGVEQGCANVGHLINQIDAVICRANKMENNGILGNYNIKERTKAMVACYPGSGSQYVMHVDNPNKDGRVITAIYYLNVNWDTKHSGGVLRIFPEHGNTIADIEPKFDRLIFFWSDKRNPHEVQPAHRTRYAITVWYFDANEREAALNRWKNKNSVKALATNNAKTKTKEECERTTSSSSTNNTSKTLASASPTLATSAQAATHTSAAASNMNTNLNASTTNASEICT